MNAIIQDIQIGPVRLIQGDARDVLLELDELADLLVTDVPYKLTSGGNATQVMGGVFSRDNYDNGGDLMDVVKWSEIGGPLYRACKPDADGYVMTNDKNHFAAGLGFMGASMKQMARVQRAWVASRKERRKAALELRGVV